MKPDQIDEIRCVVVDENGRVEGKEKGRKIIKSGGINHLNTASVGPELVLVSRNKK